MASRIIGGTKVPARARDISIPFVPDALPPAQNDVRDWLTSLGITEALGRGGAWRDAHFARPIKDYDLIVTVHPDKRESLIERLMASASEVSLDGHNRVTCMLNGGVQVDLMMHLYAPEKSQMAGIGNRPVTQSDLLEQADFGISAIVADMFSGQVWVREEFQRDSAAKEIRPVRLMFKDVAEQRGHKLHKKYPDFTLVRGPVINSRPHWV